GGDVALSFERLDVDLGGVGLAQRGLLLRHVLGIKLALRGAAALAARLARRLVPDDLRLRGGPGDGLPVLLRLRLAAGRALAVLRTGGLGPRLRAGLGPGLGAARLGGGGRALAGGVGRWVPLEDVVLLREGPAVRRDPVHEDAQREPETEEAEQRRE